MQKKLWGLGLCFAIACGAWFLGQTFHLIGGPIFAIFLGMLLSPLAQDARYQSGIAFSSKFILQLAVVLLGFGLNLNNVLTVSQASLPIILTTITTALGLAFLAHRYFKVDKEIATLVGVGSSICGGSAIAATAPVIKADEENVAKAMSVIFFFNVLAALAFPSLGQILGLSHEGFAIFAGTAVNDTSSVTATATAWDTIHQANTLEGATIVKLTRTLAIIPITFFLSILRQKNQAKTDFSLKKVFPTFLIYFLLASLITTVTTSLGGTTSWFSPLKTLSRFFIIMAMAGIGLKTNPVKLIKTGKSALYLGAACWLAITGMDLLVQWLTKTW